MIADRIRSIQAVSGGGGGGGGGFDPSQLPGLKLWLKADAGVTVDGSGNVSSWADQSGNGLDAVQNNSSLRPNYSPASFNAKPSLYFHGNSFQTLNGVPLGDGLQTYPERECLFFINQSGTRTTENWIYSEGSIGQGDFQIGRIGSYALIRGMSANQYYSPRMLTDTFYPLSVSTTSSGFTVRDFFGFSGVSSTTNYYSGGSQRSYRIASPGGYGNTFFRGDIFEVVVFDRVLSSSERTEVYNYFDAKYRFTTSLMLNMQGTPGGTTFVDESPNALTVTPYGNAQLVADATYGTVASFDGNGDYLTLPSNAAFNFGSGDFTIEFWYYPKASLTNAALVDLRVSFSSPAGLLLRQGDGLSNGLSVTCWAGTAGGTTPATQTGLVLNTWNHVAAVRTNSYLTVYVNGIGGTSVLRSINLSDQNARIGAFINATSAPNCVNGLIGPLRITKGVARYTANYTPPTGLFPASGYNPYTTLPVSGAALWLDGADSSTLFTDAGVTPVNVSGDLVYQWSDKSGNNRHATQATSGNRPTWIPPASGQNGFGAIAFNGTSQFFNTGLQGQQAATIFAVAKKSTTKSQSTTSNASLFDGIIDCDTPGQYGTGFGVNNTGGINTIYDNGFLSSASAFSSTSAEAFCYQWDSSHLSFRRNGDLTSTIQYTQGSVTNSAYVIGKSNANALYFGGTIMEIICFPSYLSLPETQVIESYLKSKWGTP